MMKAGVVIDDWKLPIFEKHLNEAGYSYTKQPGVTKDTLALLVETEEIASLKPVIEEANQECAKWKKRKKLN